MRRFKALLEILSRYRLALVLGFGCILFTQAANMAIPRFVLQEAVDTLTRTPGDAGERILGIAALLVGIALVRGVSQYWMTPRDRKSTRLNSSH